MLPPHNFVTQRTAPVPAGRLPPGPLSSSQPAACRRPPPWRAAASAGGLRAALRAAAAPAAQPAVPAPPPADGAYGWGQRQLAKIGKHRIAQHGMAREGCCSAFRCGGRAWDMSAYIAVLPFTQHTVPPGHLLRQKPLQALPHASLLGHRVGQPRPDLHGSKRQGQATQTTFATGR